MNRRDALKTLALTPLIGGVAAAAVPTVPASWGGSYFPEQTDPLPKKFEGTSALMSYYILEPYGDLNRLVLRLKHVHFECEDLGWLDILHDPHDVDPKSLQFVARKPDQSPLLDTSGLPLYTKQLHKLQEYKKNPIFQVMEISSVGSGHKRYWCFRACDEWWQSDRVPSWVKTKKLVEGKEYNIKDTLKSLWDTRRSLDGEYNEDRKSVVVQRINPEYGYLATKGTDNYG